MHSLIDHTAFNCFVCCILTHGELGEICGIDSTTVDIMDLVACFNHCNSLCGKPKIFFSRPVGTFQRRNQVRYVDSLPYVMVYETHVFYWENLIYSRNAKILFASFIICLVYMLRFVIFYLQFWVEARMV